MTNNYLNSDKTTWLITGAAGFIGMHTCLKLLARGEKVIGLDNINDYYDVNLKKDRLSILKRDDNFEFVLCDIKNFIEVSRLFKRFQPSKVIHLAAQAGVRYSIMNPHAYIESNINGFTNILECCRHFQVKHLVYASSSSVYGLNSRLPFTENQNVDHPVSLYAATKKSNELMAHTYSHLFDIPTTGLRFFTVYGPWGRPDMALFLFTKAMLAGKTIDVFNHGNMVRDFTYVDDIVEAVIRVADKPASVNLDFDHKNPEPSTSSAPYKVFNIGNNSPVPLLHYINSLEKALGIEANKNFLPIQPGDVPATASDTNKLNSWIGYKPSTSVELGVNKFVEWYLNYYKYKKLR
jgi:UDP-glucuronate 4-epimerase